MLGPEFSALDVIVGYNLIALDAKVGWLHGDLFPKLHEYYHHRLVPRAGFQAAVGGDPKALY